jgi:hypothetical protein
MDHDHYLEWQKSERIHRENLFPYYASFMCLKETNAGPRVVQSEHTNSCILLPARENLKHLCVLPKGHKGKCCHHYDGMFTNNDLSKKLKKKCETAIYKTPGNDDYVYKNRASRLFPIVLSNSEGRKIRDKTVKKSCAIPLQDASTPFHLAAAFIDFMVFINNIEGIEKLLNTNYAHFTIVQNMLTLHKEHLIKKYAPRKLFDEEGYTICVISQQRCKLENFCDDTRDMRTDCRDTDIQMGHVESRSDHVVSIRGENLLPMSRRGNLLIGEHNFMENTWFEELQRIVQLHN